VSLFGKVFNPKDAKPHERHNRARAALLAYKQEAGLDESYITGISDRSVLCGMLVDIQLMLVEMERERELQLHVDNDPAYREWPNHPDADGLDFIVSIAAMDIYRGAETTGSTFIVMTGPDGGEYQTTDNLLRMMAGFFRPDR
jgi:hypothetical protein